MFRRIQPGPRGFLLLAVCLLLAISATPAFGREAGGSLDRSFGPVGSGGMASFSLGDFDLSDGWMTSASLPNGSAYILAGTPARLFKVGPDGNPVSSFGTGGARRLQNLVGIRPVEWDHVFAAPDGGAILIGTTGYGLGSAVVNRLLPNGKQNKRFAGGGPRILTDESWANGTVDSYGRIVLASWTENLVTRLKASGTRDRSFGRNGIANPDNQLGNSSDFPYDLVANHEGIYVVGYNRTFRLTSSGALDRDFGGGDGYVDRGGNRADAMDDGLMLQSWNGHVNRLLEDGTPDPDYGPDGDGKSYNEAANQGNGTLLEDGSLIFVSDRGDHENGLYDITRLDPHGLPDPNFAGDGRLEADWLDGPRQTLLWTIPGKGAAIWGSDTGQALVHLVDRNGNVDPGFGEDETAAIPTLFQPDSEMTDAGERGDHSYLTVGSISQSDHYNNGVAIASFRRDGKPETGFGDGGRLILQSPSLRWDPKPRLTMLPSGGAMVCAKVARDSVVWKVDRHGEPARGFGTDGRLTLPFRGRCQDISFDGKGAVISAMDIVGGRRGIDLTRILPNGEIDQSYGDDGVARRTEMADGDYFWIYNSILETDRQGRTLLVVSDGDARYIVRYRKDGLPDRSFGFDGKLHYGLDSVWQGKDGQKPIYLRGLGSIRGVSFGPGGSIYLTGSYGKDEHKRAFVARLNSRGFPVKGYGKRGVALLPEKDTSQAPYFKKAVHARAQAVRVRSDGSAIVTGIGRPVCSEPLGCSNPLMIKRVGPRGRPDLKFGKRASRAIRGRPDAAGQKVFFDGGKVVVTGSVEFAVDRRNFMIARFR